MSRPYRTVQQYLDSGRIPFTFCDDDFASLGPITVYNFKRGEAHREYRRQAKRILAQKERQQETERSSRRMLDRYRRMIIAESRKVESALGIIPLNERSLFDDNLDALNDGELNIIGIRTEEQVIPEKKKKTKRKGKRVTQTKITFTD